LLHQNWEFISSGWVQGQIKYHRDKAKKEALRNNYLKKFGKWGFILAITVSCIHLAFSIAGAHDHHVDGLALTIEELLPILAITLPAAGAAFSGYLTNVRTSVTRMCQDIGYP
jgi:Mn2+/Fe2+ NRAMP family transporter